MPDLKTCDLCGKSPAYRTELGINLDAVVPGTVSTGLAEAVDACEACRPKAISKLVEHVRDALEEQIGVHADIAAVVSEVEVAAAAVARTGAPLAPYAGVADAPAELLGPHRKNLEALSARLASREEKVLAGTELLDRRTAALRENLKK